MRKTRGISVLLGDLNNSFMGSDVYVQNAIGVDVNVDLQSEGGNLEICVDVILSGFEALIV